MTKKIFTTIILTIILFCGLLAGSIYLTRHLTAKAEQGNNKPTPSEELSLKGYWYFDDGGIQWFNIKDEEVESGIGFLEDNKLLITPAIVVCPISSISEDENFINISLIVDGETLIEDYLVFDKNENSLTISGEIICIRANEVGEHSHAYGEWEIDVNPTYTQEGSKHRTCTRCDAEETEAISKLDVVIEIEENLLIIPEINPSEGTINLYYTEVGSDVTASYVIGNVTSFDLTTLLTIDYMPMEAGKTYELKIMYDSGVGDYIYSNVITYESPVNYEYDGYWLYDIEGSGTWVIRMTETTFELAEATKVDGKYQLSGAFEFFALNSNVTVGTHINLYVSGDNEVLLYFDTATNLLVYSGMNATRITEDDVIEHIHNMQLIRIEGTECIGTTSYYKCSECGKEETITSLGIGHSFDQISIGGGNVERIPATCTSPAYDKEKCTREGCNEYLLTPVEGSSALGHDYVNGTCTRCGDFK